MLFAAVFWGLLLARTGSALNLAPRVHLAPRKNPSCTLRSCFQDGSQKCPICRESPPEKPAPSVPADWVPDATQVRKMFLSGKDMEGNPFPPPLHPDLCQDISVGTYDSNKKALIQSGVVATLPRQPSEGPKVLCLAYATSEHHATSIRAMRETWAGGCDGFVVFSNESDPRIPAIKLEIEGKEAYENVWQKIRSVWRFTADHYLDQFDFFYIATRDTYLMPENLRKYLRTVGDGTKKAMYLGRRFKYPWAPHGYNGGGAGYVLSRKALQILADNLENPTCLPRDHVAAEDVRVSMCLKRVADLEAGDTRDSMGRERFHPFDPRLMNTWRPPPKPAVFPADTTGVYDWFEAVHRERGFKVGKDCCSPDTVSYHYMTRPASVRHLHALLYQCPARQH